MTPSDIIAIVAILMSAVVSIVAGIITYQNNKANIMARRSELALQKRLSAFEDIVEQMGKTTSSMYGARHLASLNFDSNDRLKYAAAVRECSNKLMESFLRYRVYLSPDLAHQFQEFVKHVNAPLDAVTKGELKTSEEQIWRTEARTRENAIVSAIQEYIGL